MLKWFTPRLIQGKNVRQHANLTATKPPVHPPVVIMMMVVVMYLLCREVNPVKFQMVWWKHWMLCQGGICWSKSRLVERWFRYLAGNLVRRLVAWLEMDVEHIFIGYSVAQPSAWDVDQNFEKLLSNCPAHWFFYKYSWFSLKLNCNSNQLN